MKNLLRLLPLFFGVIVVATGCSALSSMMHGEKAKPTADAQPTAQPSASGFVFYDSYAKW